MVFFVQYDDMKCSEVFLLPSLTSGTAHDRNDLLIRPLALYHLCQSGCISQSRYLEIYILSKKIVCVVLSDTFH